MKKAERTNAKNLVKAERLAAEVLNQIDGALCSKLREVKEQLEELRPCFKNLGKLERIAGCRTWEQFCADKLHRTASAVRKLLAEGAPGRIPAASADSGGTYNTAPTEVPVSVAKRGKHPRDRGAAEVESYKEDAPNERSSTEQEALLLANCRSEAVAAATRFLRLVDGNRFVIEWRAFQLEVLNDLSDKLESANVTSEELQRMPPEFEEMAPLESRSAN